MLIQKDIFFFLSSAQNDKRIPYKGKVVIGNCVAKGAGVNPSSLSVLVG